MSELIVYSASAGSGKTYRLALEYIKQVLQNPESFKNILAVTFTNKATNEMKSRILEELSQLAQGQETGFLSDVERETQLSKEQITMRANRALKLILHNYSQFAISTIDSFVQRIIQALLWEIDEQGTMDIELDTNSIIEKATDLLLDSAALDTELLEWISTMAYSRMDEGKSWDIRGQLIELGKQLYSEKFRMMPKADIDILTKRENINAFKETLSNFSLSTIKMLRSEAENALQKLAEQGLNIENFFHGKSGVMGFFAKCAELENNATQLPNVGARVENALNSPNGEDWVSKKVQEDHTLFPHIQSAVVQFLHPTLLKLVEALPAFKSTQLVLRNLGNLALIADLWNKIKELSQQEGFMLLSDSGHLLRELIHDSDTPFVYEKVGTRYDMFMIDEFQDTSEVQWHNFKPLINNSLSQGHFSMIVGDVKQSIYRWRNGNWSILANEVNNDFKHQGVNRIPLTNNWRSLPNVVAFNNQFFDYAKEISAHHISSTFEQPVGLDLAQEFKLQIEKAYADIKQTPMTGSDADSGYVEINLYDEVQEEYFEKVVAPDLIAKILELKKQYPLNHMGILVRKKSEGQTIANMFLEHNRNEPNAQLHIPFVSQDGLLLKSSNVVSFMISALSIINDKNNEREKRVFAKQLEALKEEHQSSWHQVFSLDGLNDDLEWLSTLNTKPLQEIFEAVVDRFQLKNIKGELAYLAELHEYIATFSGKGSGNINRFLEWWKEKKDNLSLSVPETPNALSIITIHKSKGLEYPIVFVPFADWQFREKGKTPTLWVNSTVPPLDMLPKYPIASTGSALESYFMHYASEEIMKELVDSLNLLYVAFTRAKRELFIYLPQEKKSNSKREKSVSRISDITRLVLDRMDILTSFSNDDNGLIQYSVGTMGVEPPKKKEKEKAESWIIDDYPVGQNHSSINLQMESVSFFRGEVSPTLEPLFHGKVMHQIFSQIETSHQVEEAVHQANVEGLIGQHQQQELIEYIHTKISEHPYSQWFDGSWEVKNEQSILTPQGFTYRPDRVMVRGDEAVIIDFKFGVEASQYIQQVLRYKKLLAQMKYSNLKAFIWYMDQDKLVEV